MVGEVSMAKPKTLMDEIRQELTSDPELNELYFRELVRLQLANQIVKLRERAGLSQAALARRIGTKQAGIARMERSTYRGYTVSTLAKIAAAAGARLEVRFVPTGRLASRGVLRTHPRRGAAMAPLLAPRGYRARPGSR